MVTKAPALARPMRLKWIAPLFLCFSFLVAEEFDSPSVKSGNKVVVDERENYFQISTPYKIAPNVNPLTGDLIEEEVDLTIAGAEPLSVRRFYNHTATDEPRYGSWHYNPESFLVANFEWGGQERFAAVGTFDGSVASFKQATPSLYDFDFRKGYVNFHPDGQTHPLNTKINYSKLKDPKNYHRFVWQGTVVDGSGSVRQFRSPMHAWLHHVNYKIGKKTFLAPGSNTTYQLNPNVWTPYQLPIYEEKKPNGNIICYSYERWKDDNRFPHPHLLKTISAYNKDKSQLLGSLTFQYIRDKKDEVLGFKVIGSDGRELTINHHRSSPMVLSSAQRPDKPALSYSYDKQQINRIDKPEGRVVTTKYDENGKVAAQYAPLGPDGGMHPIGRYVYHDRSTEVFDAEGHKTVYHFDEHKQVLAIAAYRGDDVYRTDRFIWDETTGNLLKKSVEDGAGTILQITEYNYDHNHNPILEKVGDGHQWHTIHRTFSEEGLNLKLFESDQEGRFFSYTYLPNTNLLASELLYEGEAIRKRTFYRKFPAFFKFCLLSI